MGERARERERGKAPYTPIHPITALSAGPPQPTTTHQGLIGLGRMSARSEPHIPASIAECKQTILIKKPLPTRNSTSNACKFRTELSGGTEHQTRVESWSLIKLHQQRFLHHPHYIGLVAQLVLYFPLSPNVHTSRDFPPRKWLLPPALRTSRSSSTYSLSSCSLPWEMPQCPSGAPKGKASSWLNAPPPPWKIISESERGLDRNSDIY